MDNRHVMNEDREREANPFNRMGECFGKEAYASKADAISRIKHTRKRHGHKGKSKGWGKQVILAPYRCPHCHEWHVGGTTPTGRHGTKHKVY
jgi:hypothetical protein